MTEVYNFIEAFLNNEASTEPQYDLRQANTADLVPLAKFATAFHILPFHKSPTTTLFENLQAFLLHRDMEIIVAEQHIESGSIGVVHSL